MFLVGLTGGISTGKSTVCRILKETGVPIIDADLISREVVEPGKPAYLQLRAYFGDEFFYDDGPLDRKKLGEVIFNDKAKRAKMNSIIHPYVNREILAQIFWHFLRLYPFVVLDIPLLFETKMTWLFSKIIVVYCSSDKQIERLIKRDSSNAEQAKSRISAQMPMNEKLWGADFIIDNNGDERATEKKVLNVLGEIRRSRLHWFCRFVLFGACSVFIFILLTTVRRIF